MPKKKKELSLKDVIHPIEFHYQRSIPDMVLDWTNELVHYLQCSYDRQLGGNPGRYKFEVETGRKYHKIVAKGQGVHAFIDKKTGQVYKPASHKSPAKHVRYDLRSLKERTRCYNNADWAGSYLYLRG